MNRRDKKIGNEIDENKIGQKREFLSLKLSEGG